MCCDEQNRLVWAGTQGTPSAGSAGSCGPTPAADTLPGGSYQYSLGYDPLDRFTTGPLGAASYAEPAHPHAVTSEGTNYYTAAYDAAGNMVCRAENTAAGTCAGSNPATWTGAALGWDSAGRLVSWQNTQSSPSSTDAFAYDGEGQRVWQQSTASGTPSTTVYVGANLTDYTYGAGGSSTGHTNRYVLPGGTGLLGVRGGSSTHLFLTDHLGTPVVQLDGTSGAVQNELLTQPYGRWRYAATTLYTYAFTGQRRDTTPDVMYFNARFYDQQSGAFVSADTVLDGLNRYAYVGGNPESATDPSGHEEAEFDAPGAFGGWSNGSNEGGGGGGGAAAGAAAAAVAYALDEELAGDSAAAGAGAAGAGAAEVGAAGGDVTLGDVTWTDDGQSVTIANPNGTFTVEDTSLYESDFGDFNEGFSREDLNAEQQTAEPPPSPAPPSGENGAGDNGIGGGSSGGSGTGGTGGSLPRVNPNDVNFTQSTISNQGGGYTVEGNIAGLENGTLSPDEKPFDPIRVFTKTEEMNEWGPKTKYGYTGDPVNLQNGRLYSLDNRRLYAFQKADGVQSIPVQYVDDDVVFDQRWKFTTTNFGMDITLMP